jgi:hypothetical protein
MESCKFNDFYVVIIDLWIGVSTFGTCVSTIELAYFKNGFSRFFLVGNVEVVGKSSCKSVPNEPLLMSFYNSMDSLLTYRFKKLVCFWNYVITN